MENIKENNKLIAEFLGYPLDEKENLHWIDTEESYGYKTSDLKFHNDWNWLIEAVEKIERLGFLVHIDTVDGVKIFNPKTQDMVFVTWKSREFTTKFESTYEAVVEFIKFYNENK